MRVWVETQLTNITGFRLEALTNPNLTYGGPGLLGKGTFLVREFTVDAYLLDGSTTNRIKFRRALADQEAPGFGIANAIDGDTDKGGWTPAVTPDRRNKNHNAVFECEQPFGFPGGTRLLITIHQKYDSKDDKEPKLDCAMLGCMRLSATTDSVPLKVDPLSVEQRRLLAIPANQRSPEQNRQLFEAFRLGDATLASLNQKIDNAWTNWPYPPTTLVLQARARPRVTHIFKRGDRLRPGDEVQPGTLSVLHPFPEGAPSHRLGS